MPDKPVVPVIVIVDALGGSSRCQNPNMPHVYWDDAAVTRGDGIFETLLIHDGQPVSLQRHLQRFIRSAEKLDLVVPDTKAWEEATQLAIDEWRKATTEDAVCVWTLTRGRATTGLPSAWITVRPIQKETQRLIAEGIKVLTGPRGYEIDAPETGRISPWSVIGAKTLGYAAAMAAQRYAQRHGFDDVIFTAGDKVLEGTTSSVIAVKGKTLLTPAPGKGILPGTTQAAIFHRAGEHGWKCEETDLTLHDLKVADSVWLVSSVRRAVRVTRINEMDLPAPNNEDKLHRLFDKALFADSGFCAPRVAADEVPIVTGAAGADKKSAAAKDSVKKTGKHGKKAKRKKKKSKKK